MVGGKGNGRGEDAISYGQSQWIVGTCNNVRNCYLSFRRHRLAARSPDLTVPVFFLWGFLKDRVFRRRIVTIEELKQAIVDEVAAIDEDLRRCVYGDFQTRWQQCIDVNRGYLPDVIFRK